MDPVYFMFAGILLLMSWFCLSTAWAEYGGPQRWFTPTYIVMAMGEIAAAVWLTLSQVLK